MSEAPATGGGATPSASAQSAQPQSSSGTPQSPQGTASKTGAPASQQPLAQNQSGQGSQGGVNRPQGASSLPADEQPQVKQEGDGQSQKKPRKYQIKVDGKVSDIDLDSITDDELVKRIQMGTAAQRRMQEAAEMRKNVESLVELLKKDPIAALKDPSLGIDVRKMVEDQILKEYEESQMSEPERKARQLERQLQEREAKIKEFEAQREREAQVALKERVFQETQQQFVEALEQEGIPKSKETIYMMAEIALVNLDHGIELTPAQMASEVRNRIIGNHQHITKLLDGEALMKHLGDDVITKVLKYAVEKVKAQQNQQAGAAFSGKPVAPTSDVANDLGTEERPKRRMQDLREWRKAMKDK
jgi:hypothetical protein